MEERRGVVKVLLFFGIFFLCLNSILAASSNETLDTLNDTRAQLCLNESEDIMNLMISDGFNVVRINDTLKEAKTTYDSQIILQEKKKNYDFTGVYDRCDQIKNIRESALQSLDDFNGVIRFYNKSISPDMNSSSADKIINEIRSEIRDERYENVPSLVEKAYSEITAIQSTQTALNLFYDATTKSFKKFILNNWKLLLGIIILLVLSLTIFRKQISIWLIKRKLSRLDKRKETIKELIMRTQRSYFHVGNMAEGEYNIKTKKYAELIRDIERQIPLLQEELALFERKLNKK